MTDLTPAHPATLAVLVDKASAALARAKTSAEVLEAKALASVAYDAAKSANRIAKAKKAHDALLSEIHAVQADALVIEAQAKIRLADEYDAAQERGEVKTQSDNQHVAGDNKLSTADLGLRRDQIHEARQFRNAEQENPGIIEDAAAEMLGNKQEPTKARMREVILTAVAHHKKQNKNSRKNPNYKPDPNLDRVIQFGGSCEALLKFGDQIDVIAAFEGEPFSIEAAEQDAAQALSLLTKYLELRHAKKNSR